MNQEKINPEYVLITSMNFPSGGAGATYLNLFCKALRCNGVKVSVKLLKGYAFGNYVHGGARKNVSPDGIPYSYLGFRHRPGNEFFKLIEELVSLFNLFLYLTSLIPRRKRIRILLYNSEVHFNVPIFLYAGVFKIKTIKFIAEIVDRSEFTNSFFGKVKWYGYVFNFNHLNKFADRLIVFSFYLKEQFVRLGFKERDIYVQPNLTDFDYWNTTESNIKYILGYSGAPYLKDGLSDLFKAMSLLNGKKPDLTLLVIGDAVFGKSLIPGLKLECERLGISDKVFFTGLVESSQVKKYLSECRILTLTRPLNTQTRAGFPTKLGEYFATHRPVITTNFGDMEKYFTDGKDMIIAKCGDPVSIAEKIEWMLDHDHELETISKRGYERARELLEYRTSVGKMLDFINFN
jgi:glycosyltransferase involved in cell wall biosynthesis